MTNRQDRVAAAIHKEMATLMLYEMRDPRLAGVTVTHAKISRDLTSARVYITMLGTSEELNGAVDALNDATGFIRSRIGPRINLRTVPEFHFYADTSYEQARRVDELLAADAAEFGPAPGAPAANVKSDSKTDDEIDEADDVVDVDDEDKDPA